MKKLTLLLLLCLATVFTSYAQIIVIDGEDLNDDKELSADELAKQLQNPISSLISVPFQGNLDFGVGPSDGTRFKLNVQPVVPMSISEDWNLILRVILPFITQTNVAGPSGTQTGLGDAVISNFFSPKAPTSGGVIWGAGPVLLVPTATDSALGTEKFGIGPTAVALKQSGSITIGALVNHIWSVAGASDRTDVNATFFQPFIGKNFDGGFALALNAEMTQNWDVDSTVGSLDLSASKVSSIGNQMVQFFIGPRFPFGNGNTTDWGIRGGFILLFPKGN